MKASGHAGRYRVWIARYHDWEPNSYHAIPPGAVALEPAEPRALTSRQAHRYVEAFNRAALARRHSLWAVAVPVGIQFLGEPSPGQPLKLP